MSMEKFEEKKKRTNTTTKPFPTRWGQLHVFMEKLSCKILSCPFRLVLPSSKGFSQRLGWIVIGDRKIEEKSWGKDKQHSEKGWVINLLEQHKDHDDHGLSALFLFYLESL